MEGGKGVAMGGHGHSPPPSVVIFLLMSGARRWYVVGSYVPPNNVPDLNHVEQVLRLMPKGLEITLMGDLNERLGYPCDECEEDLETTLVDKGLVNIIDHFMP